MTRPGRVAVAVLAAALLSACGTSTTPKPKFADFSSPSPAPAVVPYADLPPAGQVIPATRTREKPAPAPAGTPACRASQLAVHLEPAGAAAGTAFVFYRFRLVSGPSCALEGTPRIAGLQNGQLTPLQFEAKDVGGDYDWHGPVLVDRTHIARVRLAWGDAEECAAPVDNTSVVITLPGDGGIVPAAGIGTFDTCENGSGSGSTVIYVGRFEPLHVTPSRWVSAWRGLEVTTPWRQVNATAGSTLDLRVTFLSRGHDTSLAVCPDFTVAEYGGWHSNITTTHQLNCAGVTTVDANGTPYLPADVPVTFDEPVGLPDSSVPKLTWSITARGLALSTGASVQIG